METKIRTEIRTLISLMLVFTMMLSLCFTAYADNYEEGEGSPANGYEEGQVGEESPEEGYEQEGEESPEDGYEQEGDEDYDYGDEDYDDEDYDYDDEDYDYDDEDYDDDSYNLQWVEDDTHTLRYAQVLDGNCEMFSYTVHGKVNGSWVRTTYDDCGYSAAIEPANADVTIAIEPSFCDEAVKLEYTLTNEGTEDANFRFWVGVDTQIGITDYSVNKANATHTRLTMAGKTTREAAENNALFSIDSRNQGFYVKSIHYYNVYKLLDGWSRLDEVPELTGNGDSGLLATWPAATLAPGESISYYTLLRIGEAKFIPVTGITATEEMLDDSGELRETYQTGDYFNVDSIFTVPSAATNADIIWDESTLPPTDENSCLTQAGSYTIRGVIANGRAEEGENAEESDFSFEYSFTVSVRENTGGTETGEGSTETGEGSTETGEEDTETGEEEEVEEYSVFFNMGGHGAEVATQSVALKGKVERPDPEPEEDHWIFLGWYKAGLQKAWTFLTDLVEGDTTLFAKWAKGDYTVRFQEKGYPDLYVSEGEAVTLPENQTDGFLGWNVNGTVCKAGESFIATDDVLVKAMYGKATEVDGKERSVVNENCSIDLGDADLSQTDQGEEILDDISEGSAALQHKTNISSHVKKDALKNYLTDSDADMLIFYLDLKLDTVEGHEDEAGEELKMMYNVEPMVYTRKYSSSAASDDTGADAEQGSTETEPVKVDNEDLEGTITFALPVPNHVTKQYGKVEHLNADGTVKDTQYCEIKKSTDSKGVTCQYVEVECSSFSNFVLSFTDTNPDSAPVPTTGGSVPVPTTAGSVPVPASAGSAPVPASAGSVTPASAGSAPVPASAGSVTPASAGSASASEGTEAEKASETAKAAEAAKAAETSEATEAAKAAETSEAAETAETAETTDSAYVSKTVAVSKITSDEDDGSQSAARPATTGTEEAPVSNGIWNLGSDGKWTYTTNAPFRSTWAYIYNPYTKDAAKKYGWFYFDANGKMLVGWQKINGKWYYLNPVSDGTLGMCYLNTTTPDGCKVDESGARVA